MEGRFNIGKVVSRYEGLLRPRIYFDPGRSRLMDIDGAVYDFSWFGHRGWLECWCELEGVEFVDVSLERLPDFLHASILAARRAACGPVQNIASYGREGRGRRTARQMLMASDLMVSTDDGPFVPVYEEF